MVERFENINKHRGTNFCVSHNFTYTYFCKKYIVQYRFTLSRKIVSMIRFDILRETSLLTQMIVDRTNTLSIENWRNIN